MKRVLWALFGASFCAAFALSNSARAQAPLSDPPGSTSAASATAADSRAGVEPQAEPAEASVTTPDTPAPSNERAAQAAYDAARIMYTNNDFSGALASMGEAYRLSQRPQLLYNLGLLEAKLEHCEAALKDYTQYLLLVPQGLHRDEAQQASLQLKHDCPVDDTPSAAPASSRQVEAAPSSVDSHAAQPHSGQSHGYWTPARIFGWPAVTTGIFVGGAATYFTLAALSARNEYQQQVNNEYQQQVNRQRIAGPAPNKHLPTEQHHDQVAAQVLGVSAGALFVSGVLALLLSPHDHGAAEHAALEIQANGVAASYAQRF